MIDELLLPLINWIFEPFGAPLVNGALDSADRWNRSRKDIARPDPWEQEPDSSETPI